MICTGKGYVLQILYNGLGHLEELKKHHGHHRASEQEGLGGGGGVAALEGCQVSWN